MLDSLYVLESAMRHFYIRAEMGKNAGRKQSEVDQDYKQAAALAAMVTPYRHARLSAVKLAGDPNSRDRLPDDASLEELRAAVKMHIERLAPVLNLDATPVPRTPQRHLDVVTINRHADHGGTNQPADRPR